MSQPNLLEAELSTTLSQAQGLVTTFGSEENLLAANRLDVSLAPDRLIGAVKALIDARWGYLSAIIGLDDGVETLEVLYTFCAGANVLTLRVQTPRNASRVPTLTELIPSAVLFERELREMFGVTVRGLANPGPLFLADDWPADVFPLLKDAVLPDFVEENA